MRSRRPSGKQRRGGCRVALVEASAGGVAVLAVRLLELVDERGGRAHRDLVERVDAELLVEPEARVLAREASLRREAVQELALVVAHATVGAPDRERGDRRRRVRRRAWLVAVATGGLRPRLIASFVATRLLALAVHVAELVLELLDRGDVDVERGPERPRERARLRHADEVRRDAHVHVARVRVTESGERAALGHDEHDDDRRLAVLLRRALDDRGADLREPLLVGEVKEALGGHDLLPLNDRAVLVLDLDRADEVLAGVSTPFVAAHGCLLWFGWKERERCARRPPYRGGGKRRHGPRPRGCRLAHAGAPSRTRIEVTPACFATTPVRHRASSAHARQNNVALQSAADPESSPC